MATHARDPRASTHGTALQEIARDIVRIGVGGRLPTSLRYQEQLDVGSGTVQKALRLLSESTAVDLRARGHRGTFIENRDLAQLWHLADLPPVHLIFPPPGPVESLGLAAGLGEAFARIDVPLTIGYRRGAEPRLRLLREREADMVVLSSGAARHLDDAEDGDQYRRVELNAGSYYGPGSLVVVARPAALTDPAARVGIDHSSNDHTALTVAEFPDAGPERFVECDFTTIPAAILRGEMDLGVWHKMDLLIPPELAGLALQPLKQLAARRLSNDLSSAVLVYRKDTEAAAALDQLDLNLVRMTQQDVFQRGPDAVETSLRVRPR